MAHELWLVKGPTMTDITPLIGTITRRSNKDELGEEISFDIAFNDVKHFPKNPCEIGDMIVLKNADYEITRALIVEEDRNGINPIGYTAFDFAFYLNKSKSIYQFRKMRADQCIRKVVKDFGVPIGNIVSMPVEIDKIFPDDAPSDIIKEIIEVVEQKLGVKYLMEMRQGKLFIEMQGNLLIKARFSFPGMGLIDANNAVSNPSRRRSITDMINSIQVVGNDDKLVLTRDDTAMVNKYGKLQKVVQLDQDEKLSASQIAQNELKELSKVTEEVSIELIGDDSVRAGRLLEVNEPVTGIKGTYLINDVNHTISGGIHKMSLGLEER